MANPTIELDIPDAKIEIIDRRTNMMTRQMVRFLTDIVRRLGGQRTDYVRTARTKALESEAMVNAILRGVTTGYYHTPATDLLSYTATSATQATISVAAHTRSTASAAIQAGTVTGVTRGSVYYVYYDDAGNLGGAVTFAATTSLASLTTAGRKIVGAIYVEEQPPSAGPG